MLRLRPGQGIHLIGIGGAGLSAIARILLERGFVVSGSDLRTSAITDSLSAAGARVFEGHDASHINGADIVLATSAAPPDHIELLAAEAAGLPVYRRRDFIGALLRGYDTIAVAGTHGKTTTTAMIVHILQASGMDPSYIVGGAMGNTGRNAAVGRGKSFVIEADEYDNMFHGLEPDLAVITNVEHEHPDFFKSPSEMIGAFETFVSLVAGDGMLVVCADDPGADVLAAARREAGGKVLSYGIENPAADWRASDLTFDDGKSEFAVFQNGVFVGEVRLGIPGLHNVLNALAALIVAAERGVTPEQSAAALRGFKATARRFEIRGERDGVIVVDDYAHHPTEIRVNIQAARLRYPGRQVWVIWQPHTYSRVRQFWTGFVSAFAGADRVLVTPIYAAREAPVEGISSERLVEEMAKTIPTRYAPSFDEAVQLMRRFVEPPAVVLIFSAGDANRIAELYLDEAT